MGNCRWWVRGIRKFRTLKKNSWRPNQDGVTFTWDGWNKELSEVRTLKPGDKIWNPYRSFWDTVKSVEFHWQPIQRRKFDFNNDDWSYGKVLGQWISEFRIHTEGGYIIYDSPSSLKQWCENYGIVKRQED